MSLCHRIAVIFAALALCLSTGCYWDRLTWNYGDMQELSDGADALVEESYGLSEAELLERENELKV